MRFRARFTGQLVLANGPIRTSRAVEKSQTIILSAKTVERFGRSIYGHVKSGRRVAEDQESNAFARQPKEPEDKPLVANPPAPEPEAAPEPVEAAPEPVEVAPDPEPEKKRSRH